MCFLACEPRAGRAFEKTCLAQIKKNHSVLEHSTVPMKRASGPWFASKKTYHRTAHSCEPGTGCPIHYFPVVSIHNMLCVVNVHQYQHNKTREASFPCLASEPQATCPRVYLYLISLSPYYFYLSVISIASHPSSL